MGSSSDSSSELPTSSSASSFSSPIDSSSEAASDCSLSDDAAITADLGAASNAADLAATFGFYCYCSEPGYVRLITNLQRRPSFRASQRPQRLAWLFWRSLLMGHGSRAMHCI